MDGECRGEGDRMTDQTRNLNPTPEAYFAMYHWHKRYSSQCGGSMDFWDSLSESEKGFCKDAVIKINSALYKQIKDK